MVCCIALNDDDRRPWLRAIVAEIGRRRANGTSVIIACSALKRAYRDVLVHGRRDVRIVFLSGSQPLVASRLASRKGHFMPPDLLASQFRTLEPPGSDEHPITISIEATVDSIVDTIIQHLNPGAADRGASTGDRP